MKHVIIVMTMWDAFKTSARVGDDRVQELERDYFSDALRHGARTAHHNNTPESAVGILEQLVGEGAEPNALRIQREMVDDRVEVVYTGAGRELMEQLGAEAMRLEKDARAHEEKARRLRLKSEKLRTRSASACPCDCRGDSEDPQHVEIICNRRAESNSSVNIVCPGAPLLCHGYRDVDVLMQSGPDKGKNELFTASSAGSN